MPTIGAFGSADRSVSTIEPQAIRDPRQTLIHARLVEDALPEAEAREQIVGTDLECDERNVLVLQHGDGLIELCALGVGTQTSRAIDRARALAGTAELDKPQIRVHRLLELEHLLGVAAVLVALGLEARRERVTKRDVHASRRRRGVPNGHLALRGRGKCEPQNEEHCSDECDQCVTDVRAFRITISFRSRTSRT